MSEDQELALQIASVSPLSYDNALLALKRGGRARQMALDILLCERRYAMQNARTAEALQRLAALIPA